MDTESQWIYDRMTLHRLMEEHPNWSVEQYACALNRTTKWVRKWRSRLLQATKKHFNIYLSQSRAPRNRRRVTRDPVKRVIGELRQQLSAKFNRKAGGDPILYELHRRDDLREAGHFIPTSDKTITRVLWELGYIQRPKRQPRQPVILPDPNEEW
jgi:hypothetical protein